MNAAMTPINATDLSVMADEARIRDVRVGARLGFTDPRMIRKLIERNRDELAMHGVISTVEITPAAKGGRPGREFWLNEGQTMVVCMLSRTPTAAAVRREVIAVYMAYRNGQLGHDPIDSWEKITRRQAVVRQAIAFHMESKAPEFSETLAHLLTDGLRHRRLPRFWSDLAVRHAVIAMHRQMTIDEAHAALLDHYGPDRVPARATIGRFWIQLDRARGSAGKLG